MSLINAENLERRLTFLGRPQENHQAVSTLQLIEVRTDLDLVLSAGVQIHQRGGVFGRRFDVQDRPGAADGAVEYSVTLEVAGLVGDLWRKTRA